MFGGGAFDDVVAGAPQVYVAVRTRVGPHVTPELATVANGRVLCLTAAGSVKARRLAVDPVVGLLARHPDGRWAVASGTAEVLDAASPASLLRSPVSALTAPLDIARYARDNAAELTGAVGDLLTGRLGGPVPPRRVVVACRPSSTAVLDADGTVLDASGWDEVEPEVVGDDVEDVDGADLDELLADVPDAAARLARVGDVVVGWLRVDGAPLALPATWDPHRSAASVPAAAFDLVGAAAAGPVGVTFDAWSGYGPSGKQGLLVRGTGRAELTDGAIVDITVSPERATWWDGVDTGTTKNPDST